jgi:hypothetical protein
MSNPVKKVANVVSTAGAIASALTVKVDLNDATGDVDAVKLFGFLPLFKRGKDGKARVLGIRAKRFDR